MAAPTPINPSNATTTPSPSQQNGHTDKKQDHQRLFVVAAPDHAPDHGRYVSKEEYWAVWYEAEPSYEWNNGYLAAKPMPNTIQLRLFHWFLDIMRQYAATAQNAELMGLETGFTMSVPDPERPYAMKEVIRKPDLAASSIPIRLPGKTMSGLTTASAISASKQSLTPQKAKFCALQRSKRANMNSLGCRSITFSIPVLTGFQFCHSDLKRQRSLETLATDEAYRGFVLLRYQAAEARADIAKQRAIQERQRVNDAQHHAEQYATKLRELGINPDEL